VIMMMYRIRGAIILGIFMVSIISWPRRSAITLFPYTTEGDTAYNYFKQVVGFYPLRKIGNAADYNYFNARVWQALITFLYVDLFDTTGWVFSHLSLSSFALSSLPKAMVGPTQIHFGHPRPIMFWETPRKPRDFIQLLDLL